MKMRFLPNPRIVAIGLMGIAGAVAAQAIAEAVSNPGPSFVLRTQFGDIVQEEPALLAKPRTDGTIAFVSQ